MVVQMTAGISEKDERTLAVAQAAVRLGLKPDIRLITGTETSVVSVWLLDGEKVRACTIPEHTFRVMPGVDSVRRVTPSAVDLAINGGVINHRIKLGEIEVGNDLPCLLIAGPCTVDRNIDELVGALVQSGIRHIRGGCWKPRSNAVSFPGFGKRAVGWFMEAAAKYSVSTIFIEVIDETHLIDVQQIQQEVGYAGQVVVWVGARTSNQNLLRKLGCQKRYPVMIKNPVRARSIREWINLAEFVIAGERHFDEEGSLIAERSLVQGNDQILLCSRGVEHNDEESPFRFAPCHEWITAVRRRYWPTVGVDPSHSAGTMLDDLVLRNLEAALVHQPAFAIVEVYFDGQRGLCDADQAVPLCRLHEVQAMIAHHNQRHYATNIS